MKNDKATLLEQGNKAFRDGKFQDAINFYQKSLRELPQLKDLHIFNIAISKSRINEALISSDDLTKEKSELTKLDVVMFWKQNDTGLYGRRHEMIAKSIRKLGYISKLVILDAPISEAIMLKRCQDSTLTHHKAIRSAALQKFAGNYCTAKIPVHGFVNDTLDFSSYKEYLIALFDKYHINPGDSVFWFYPKVSFDMDIIKEFRPKKVVVDIVDDHRAWPGLGEAEKEKLTSQYKSILSAADVAMANCQSVVSSMSEFHPNVQLVPNGCDTEPVVIEPLDRVDYQKLKSFRGKIIGFVGNLESKIDLLLIELLAHRFYNDLIVLVGSTHANPNIRTLQELPNIVMTGPIAYEYVNAFIRLFAIGIVPHFDTPLTNNMNPLKVYVYAANRIPVVCTKVNNVPEADFIYVADSHENFVECCESLLQGKNVFPRECFDSFVQKNSWDSRVSNVMQQLLD